VSARKADMRLACNRFWQPRQARPAWHAQLFTRHHCDLRSHARPAKLTCGQGHVPDGRPLERRAGRRDLARLHLMHTRAHRPDQPQNPAPSTQPLARRAGRGAQGGRAAGQARRAGGQAGGPGAARTRAGQPAGGRVRALPRHAAAGPARAAGQGAGAAQKVPVRQPCPYLDLSPPSKPHERAVRKRGGCPCAAALRWHAAGPRARACMRACVAVIADGQAEAAPACWRAPAGACAEAKAMKLADVHDLKGGGAASWGRPPRSPQGRHAGGRRRPGARAHPAPGRRWQPALRPSCRPPPARRAGPLRGCLLAPPPWPLRAPPPALSSTPAPPQPAQQPAPPRTRARGARRRAC